METILTSRTKTVTIAPHLPTVLIGERINPTGKKKMAAALKAGDLEFVRREALAQVEAGADVIDINVGAAGVDEVALLPQAVRIAMEAVDVPLCIDSANANALKAALGIYTGKALVNSVNGEERSLSQVLPLIKEHKAAVIGLTMDESGIPSDPRKRLEIARKIVARAETLGIPRADVLIDCLALTVGADSKAALVTLEAIKLVAQELGVNQTLGASNVSYGLPDRPAINATFLAMAIQNGLNCPIVDAAEAKLIAVSADLVLGRDEYATRYIKYFRKTKGVVKA